MEMEKRRYPRKASFEPCNVEIFFLEEFTFGSRVLNYSTGGVMLESDYLLLEWSPVTIKFDAEKRGFRPRQGVLRWDRAVVFCPGRQLLRVLRSGCGICELISHFTAQSDNHARVFCSWSMVASFGMPFLSGNSPGDALRNTRPLSCIEEERPAASLRNGWAGRLRRCRAQGHNVWESPSWQVLWHLRRM